MCLSKLTSTGTGEFSKRHHALAFGWSRCLWEVRDATFKLPWDYTGTGVSIAIRKPVMKTLSEVTDLTPDTLEIS